MRDVDHWCGFSSGNPEADKHNSHRGTESSDAEQNRPREKGLCQFNPQVGKPGADTESCSIKSRTVRLCSNRQKVGQRFQPGHIGTGQAQPGQPPPEQRRFETACEQGKASQRQATQGSACKIDAPRIQTISKADEQGHSKDVAEKKDATQPAPSVADNSQSTVNCGSSEGTSAKPAIERVSALQKTSTSANEERTGVMALI